MNNYVSIVEISANGSNIIYEGPATSDEINNLRKVLLTCGKSNHYISFLIGNEFFTFNMNKVKGFHVKSEIS
jgi:hypothetical protein